ncbi:MAG: hypothetical protein IT204_05160 [Fimbriimonadaceae bacterium]|nr:hypothetical protein [Fimbriimonadaceae bacterium]
MRRLGLLTALGAATLVVVFQAPRPPAQAAAPPRVIVWPAPAPELPASASYAVTLRAEGEAFQPFVYESQAGPADKWCDRDGLYIKVPLFGIHSEEPPPAAANADCYAHSWTAFDFAGGPVEVEVRLLQPPDGLSLPLRSCAILPRSLGLTASVSGSTIRFTLPRPAKFAVVPNAAEAVAAIAGGAPPRALEGYRNPLFLFARAPEAAAPDPQAAGTLLVQPGRLPTAEQVAAARLLYFAPGLHQWERFNPDDPDHYVVVGKAQAVYLAGGAYVFGHFRSAVFRPVGEMPRIFGRGTISDWRNRWSGIPWKDTPAKNLRLEGIQLADRHNHLTGSSAPLRDVAAVGGWHGNTDGPNLHLPLDDPFDGYVAEDCFVMACDTNLHLGGKGKVRNYTVWQQANAEPVWIRGETDDCRLEGLEVIAFHANNTRRQVFNCFGDRGSKRRLVVRNATIDVPFLPVLFRMPVDSRGAQPAFDNVLFENITVRTAGIAGKSPFGAAQAGHNTGQVTFRNLQINGTRVTAANCRDYFELAPTVTIGQEIRFD